MAADLKSITTFQRVSLLLMDDCLIKLEHERTRDRVRRFSYDTIQTVVIWQKISWLRIVLCTLCLVAPGFALLLTQQSTNSLVGVLLMTVGGGLIAWYFYCKVTTIRIVRAGTNNDIAGLFRPGRLDRFRKRLVANIRASQPAPEPAPPPAEQPNFVEAETERLG